MAITAAVDAFVLYFDSAPADGSAFTAATSVGVVLLGREGKGRGRGKGRGGRKEGRLFGQCFDKVSCEIGRNHFWIKRTAFPKIGGSEPTILMNRFFFFYLMYRFVHYVRAYVRTLRYVRTYVCTFLHTYVRRTYICTYIRSFLHTHVRM